MEIIIKIIPTIILVYFGIGVLFAIYFFSKGAAKIDPLISESKWTVRLLLVPGAIGLWPILLIRIFQPSKEKS